MLSCFSCSCCWCRQPLSFTLSSLSFRLDSTLSPSLMRLLINEQSGRVLARHSLHACWLRRRQDHGEMLEPLTRSHRPGSTTPPPTPTGRRPEDGKVARGPSITTSLSNFLRRTSPQLAPKYGCRHSPSTLFHAVSAHGCWGRCSKERSSDEDGFAEAGAISTYASHSEGLFPPPTLMDRWLEGPLSYNKLKHLVELMRSGRYNSIHHYRSSSSRTQHLKECSRGRIA